MTVGACTIAAVISMEERRRVEAKREADRLSVIASHERQLDDEEREEQDKREQSSLALTMYAHG